MTVDKRYVSSRQQIAESLESQMREFFVRNANVFSEFSTLKVYYDCGQSEVAHILHDALVDATGGRVVFAQGVSPACYKLFQLADLVCTVRLLELKLACGGFRAESETRFFGGPRDFKRNVLRKLKAKEL